MIKNIVFDLGGVLIDFTLLGDFDHLFKDQLTKDRFMKATLGSKIWPEYDRGVMSHDEIVDAFVANDPGIEEEIRNVFDDLDGIVRPRRFIETLIGYVREQGFNVYALSNMPKRVKEDCEEAFSFLSLMDGHLFSYDAKCIKPDAIIYQKLLEKFDLKAEECFFVDDIMENIEGAKQVGMPGMKYTTYYEVKEKIGSLNG